MMDVEGLLRETLNDPRRRLEPVPGMFDAVSERARQRRQRGLRLASAMTVVVLIAGVATAIGIGTQNHTKVAAPASITPSPQTGQATPINLGVGSTTSFALAPSGIFVGRTEPSQLLQVSFAEASVIKRTATTDDIDGIAADSVEGLVWTWSSSQPIVSDTSTDVGSTIVRARTTLPGTVTIDAPAAVPAYTFSAAALDGDLWLATSDGLFVVALDQASWSVTKLVSGSVFSIAADAVRDRILYGSAVGTTDAGSNSLGSIAVHEINARTRTAIAVGTPLPIGKESIAIVGDQIWVAGYGSGSTPRVFHLDGSSLEPIATSDLNLGSPLELGPGARLRSQ
ncbi:MAG TPA: hypothetical protein VGD55_10355 [Acidothermaceae bacterium]